MDARTTTTVPPRRCFIDFLLQNERLDVCGRRCAPPLRKAPSVAKCSALNRFLPWLSAEDAVRVGDRDRATSLLRALAPSSTDRAMRERASFTLALSLLAPLLDAADPSLAGDAVFLLAGSMPAPRQRLDVLELYLAKPRSSPYLEQAEVERARALREVGDEAKARAVIRSLRSEPNLPAVARAALERVERALQR
jgi:hypothetical protein